MTNDNSPPDSEVRLLTSGQVAALYRVHRKTVCRWADDGLIPSFRTPGGHHRFREHEIRADLNGRQS